MNTETSEDEFGAETLGEIPDELRDSALPLKLGMDLARIIDELAGGSTDVYLNGDGRVDRVAVVTDDTTVRKLTYTTRWSWKGPHVPDEDPHDYVEGQGYIRATKRVEEEGEPA